VLDARPRSFYSVTGAGNDHFAPTHEACDDRANGIVASVTSALCLRDGQLHELLFRFVASRDHVVRETFPLGGQLYYLSDSIPAIALPPTIIPNGNTTDKIKAELL